jgi:hypothetical protein
MVSVIPSLIEIVILCLVFILSTQKSEPFFIYGQDVINNLKINFTLFCYYFLIKNSFYVNKMLIYTTM